MNVSERGAALVVAALMPLLLAAKAQAVSTETWRVVGREGFLAADLESLAVNSEGVVTLAPAFEEVEELEASYVWDLETSGGRLVAGTGSSGIVFEVEGEKAREVLDSIALSVESIAIGKDGTIYAGTAPDATILAISRDGTSRTFADLPEKHIWGLALDAEGRLIAATGDLARVYRIDRSGTPSVLYDGRVAHFTSLAMSRTTVLAGAEEDGLLFAIQPGGQVRVIMDAREDEVKTLAVAADGTIYAGVNPAPGGESSASSSSSSSSSSSASPGSSSRNSVPRPVIYRVSPNGLVETVWTSPDPTLHAVVIAPDGTLIAATGAEVGGIYSIDPARSRWALLGRPGPPQILSLALSGDEIWIGSGSPGRVFRGSRSGSPTGVLLSAVHDTRQVADWGVLKWDRLENDGNGSISFRTRTGNSATPDPTWSEWSGPLRTPDGSPIESPPGRFIQWEATFKRGSEGSPALREVTVAFLEKNLPPVVRSVDVAPAGGQVARGGDSGGPQPVVQTLPGNVRVEFSLTTAASRTAAGDDEAAWMRRYRTVRWDAADPNEDPLQYRLEYRGRGETEWRVMEEELKDPVHVWDTAQIPDGQYKLKVVATDALQNAPAEVRTAEMESEFIDVDNTPPVVESLTAAKEGGTIKLTARLSDRVGPLKRAEVSIDGGEWTLIQPADRIFDQKTEEISVSLDVKGEGEHLVTLRAFDQTGNIGLGRAVAR